MIYDFICRIAFTTPDVHFVHQFKSNSRTLQTYRRLRYHKNKTTTKQRFSTYLYVSRINVINFSPAACYATTMRLLKVFIVVLSVVTGSYTKSIFVQPTFRPKCPHGSELDDSGMCVNLLEIDRANYELFVLAKFGSVDYSDEAEPEPPQADESDDFQNPPDSVSAPGDDFPEAPPVMLQDDPGFSHMELRGKLPSDLGTNPKDKRSTSSENIFFQSLSPKSNKNVKTSLETITDSSIVETMPVDDNTKTDMSSNTDEKTGGTSDTESESYDEGIESSTESLKKKHFKQDISHNFPPSFHYSEDYTSLSDDNHKYPLSLMGNTNIDAKNPNHQRKSASSHTTPKFSLNFSLKNKMLKKTLNVANEFSLKTKRTDSKNKQRVLVPSRTFLVTFFNTNITNDKPERVTEIESDLVDNTKPNKIRHGHKRKHLDLLGVLEKVLEGRRHKSKS